MDLGLSGLEYILKMKHMNDRIKRFYGIIQNHENDFEKLKEYQLEIKNHIIESDVHQKKYSTFAGIDVAYRENQGYAACIIYDSTEKIIKESISIIDTITFPYRSTFFSFREGPIILKLLEKHDVTKIDLLLLNGHGLMHPRIGLASHIGYLLDIPTVGVATNYLTGSFEDKLLEKGDHHEIFEDKKVIGLAYKSQEKMKPIYVSVGHKISLFTAFKEVKKLILNEKLPIPLIEAHNLANQLKSKNK